MKEVQEKMVEYYQLFEDMNKDEFDKYLKKE